jgi:hypothetical protein
MFAGVNQILNPSFPVRSFLLSASGPSRFGGIGRAAELHNVPLISIPYPFPGGLSTVPIIDCEAWWIRLPMIAR